MKHPDNLLSSLESLQPGASSVEFYAVNIAQDAVKIMTKTLDVLMSASISGCLQSAGLLNVVADGGKQMLFLIRLDKVVCHAHRESLGPMFLA